MLVQGVYCATANVDAPATIPSEVAAPMAKKVRFDIFLILLIAELGLLQALIRRLLSLVCPLI